MESENVAPIYDDLVAVIEAADLTYELIFVDDGSTDDTSQQVRHLRKKDERVRLVRFSRNFGKEAATSAGIQLATGQAILMIDADGQHPVELLPEFIERWQAGAKVVVGVRRTNQKEGFVKKHGSRVFYKVFNSTTGATLVPGSTDFRLIDSRVQKEFCQLTERNRITRGLIDWLGFEKAYVYFDANPRLHGQATYSVRKLVNLAVNTFVSMSFVPLHLFGYLGTIIMSLSFVLGLFIIVEQHILGDPLALNVTGAASLGLLILFLVGLILVSQWITSLYVSRVYEETKRRPNYIIEEEEPGPERPDGAGTTGPERPYGAGTTGPERPDRAGSRGPERPPPLGGRR